MATDDVDIIMMGSLNTDIVALGVNEIIGPGEHTYGDELQIGPGGKSRNIAEMAAHLVTPGRVAMIGRTTKDPDGLWEKPVRALEEAGVNTEHINVVESEKRPGTALIAVDEDGNNQIYVVEGISADFSPQDIDDASPLFAAAEPGGVLGFSLELPLETAIHAVKKANGRGIRTVFDPGGMEPDVSYDELLDQDIFLAKPNEHEARMLTGVEVEGMDTARDAAEQLRERGVENVLITVGSDGAYLFTGGAEHHIPAPAVGEGSVQDETGCGDQVMAALCTALAEGEDVETAAERAIAAGTLQFHRSGIDPLEREELEQHL